MNQSRPHSLVVSLLINLVLFSSIIAVGFPIFNSGDDVYLMYLLGGGFGQPPTELLHYNHILHPYMGLMLKNLFLRFPDFNWYTALLYLFHFISCTIVLWQWLRGNKFAVAVISFAIIFFSIEARFLLQPTFTNTALITAVGAVLLSHDRNLLVSSVLLAIAIMFRVHMLIPVAIISLPFYLLKPQKATVFSVVAVILLILLLFQQKQYYQQHIPGWQEEENYRRAVIHYYNVPKKQMSDWDFNTVLAADFLDHGLLWDKTMFSAQRISAITERTKTTNAFTRPDFGERLYWLFMENRLALLIFAGFFIYRFSFMSRREKLAVTVSALLVFGLCLGLLLFRKLPPYVMPGCLFVWLACVGSTGTHETNIPPKRNWMFAAGAVLLLAWSIVRIVTLNNWNKQQHQRFVCVYNQVAASPQKLFIASDDKLPMDYFHVWHTPRQYSLPNILYKDHFLNNTYQPVYKRFNISSPAEFVDNKTVLFIGPTPDLAGEYYKWKSALDVRERLLTKPSDCIHTWQLFKFPVTQ